MIKEAMLYEKLDDDNVRCYLCAHRCKISPSKRGICGVRENREGILYTLVYGTIIAENVDPIEKKPLFHVYPGSRSFSIATVGCNFHCTFCQNYDISQMPPMRNTHGWNIVNTVNKKHYILCSNFQEHILLCFFFTNAFSFIIFTRKSPD